MVRARNGSGGQQVAFRLTPSRELTAEIAAILGVAPGTVKRHVEQILAKLRVANRTAGAAFARSA